MMITSIELHFITANYYFPKNPYENNFYNIIKNTKFKVFQKKIIIYLNNAVNKLTSDIKKIVI